MNETKVKKRAEREREGTDSENKKSALLSLIGHFGTEEEDQMNREGTRRKRERQRRREEDPC